MKQARLTHISIHAPPRGATAASSIVKALASYFNSRPSARGDRKSGGYIAGQEISIHAPPRGATVSRSASPAALPFQFTPLREGRLDAPIGDAIHIDFNSRPSARGDFRGVRESGRRENFNSRPSARGDGKRYAISANLLFNPYKSAWLNNSATQFVEIILVIFHRIIA